MPARSPIERIITAQPGDAEGLPRRREARRAPTCRCCCWARAAPARKRWREALHDLGPRAKQPFVAINCGAIPENLLESELFGHERGAFTGAVKQTIGKIESANKGTLFLDEIGDLPHPLQVKLLRFLQDQIVERIGGRQRIQVDDRNFRGLEREHGQTVQVAYRQAVERARLRRFDSRGPTWDAFRRRAIAHHTNPKRKRGTRGAG